MLCARYLFLYDNKGINRSWTTWGAGCHDNKDTTKRQIQRLYRTVELQHGTSCWPNLHCYLDAEIWELRPRDLFVACWMGALSTASFLSKDAKTPKRDWEPSGVARFEGKRAKRWRICRQQLKDVRAELFLTKEEILESDCQDYDRAGDPEASHYVH